MSPYFLLQIKTNWNLDAQFYFTTRFVFFSPETYGKQVLSIVGTLQDEADPMVSVMKVEKAPLESYADIGGLEPQIQEIKVRK